MQTVDAPRVVQPPHTPELNPVERFFRELHPAIEGRVYPTLQAKQDALEPILQAWQANPTRCGNCAAGAGRPCPFCPPTRKLRNQIGLV